jgi:peptide/nickel transport system ATP-binding protein
MSTLLEVKDLKVHFPIKTGYFKQEKQFVKAVDGVSFNVNKGETLGLVGESGSGKTTVGRSILRAIDPTSGQVTFNLNGHPIDMGALKKKELRDFRKHIQMIFQDPYSSLNPRMTVRDIIAEPLVANRLARGNDVDERVRDTAELCKLNLEHLRRFPHAFSGGQRQRVGIARALVSNPEFIVCDESVSALDVSIQAEILNLLMDLQKELDLTYLFIAHDLSVVAHISNRVAVMYVGNFVELAPTKNIFFSPKHPYTEALLSAIPEVSADYEMNPVSLQGEIPNPASPPPGCRFHTRCPYVQDRCRTEIPTWRAIEDDHFVACHFAEELELRGVETTQAATTVPEKQAESVATSVVVPPPQEIPAEEPVYARHPIDQTEKREVQASTLTVYGFGKRLAALLYDGVILAAITFVLVMVVSFAAILYLGFHPTEELNISQLFFWLGLLLSAGYYLGSWTRWGQTVGKWLVGLKIISTDGSRLSGKQAILRFAGYIINGLAFSLGFLWIAFDKKRQGWHDKLANTYVMYVDDEFPGPEPVEIVPSDPGRSWVWLALYVVIAVITPAGFFSSLWFFGPIINRTIGNFLQSFL